MRLAFALLGLLFLTAAAPGRDWSTVATRTPAGTYVIGNPAAKVKLVEYASYTCPHCAAFARDSGPVLKERMVKSGSTSVEIRNQIHDAIDLSAVILARCAGPQRFAALSAAIFARQPEWLPRAADYQQANAARLQRYPSSAQFRAIADAGGLTDIAKASGLTEPAIDACFADAAAIDRIVAVAADAPAEVTGTPTFYLNGQHVPGMTWDKIEPLLRARGAK